jgi:hypothetical protein
MKSETVKVTILMPKPIHSLITKLAAVEGSKPDEWYVEALVRDVGALLGNAGEVFDVPRLVKANGLRELLGDVAL